MPSAELAYIASPHLGLVATVPFQIGFGGQTTGFEDAQLLLQWLAAGSLELDNMLSIGAMGTFPIGRDDLSSGDYYVGPFAYGAQRFFHRLIFEGNVTTLLPVVHGASTRQILGTGLVSVLLTPERFSFPVYVQVEANSTTYLGGTAALPPGATGSPAETRLHRTGGVPRAFREPDQRRHPRRRRRLVQRRGRLGPRADVHDHGGLRHPEPVRVLRAESSCATAPPARASPRGTEPNRHHNDQGRKRQPAVAGELA